MARLRALVLIAFLAGSIPTVSPAQSPTVSKPYAKVEPRKRIETVGNLTIELVDLSPRFLDFYKAARNADPEKRFALWSERYGFAAVPPTPAGDAMVKQLLADGWSRYPAALPRLKRGAAAMRPSPVRMVADVARLLQLERPARLRIVTYVGSFEDNAFTMQEEGVPVLALPLESSRGFIEMVGLHEATHAVHMLTANLSGDFERPIARVILEEGLAMRVTQALLPGRDETAYTERKPGWLAEASSRRAAIIDGLLPDLAKSDGQSVFDVTMGSGRTGLEREAYYLGWIVVGQLLQDGMSFAQIARIPEDRMAETVGAVLRRLRNA